MPKKKKEDKNKKQKVNNQKVYAKIESDSEDETIGCQNINPQFAAYPQPPFLQQQQYQVSYPPIQEMSQQYQEAKQPKQEQQNQVSYPPIQEMSQQYQEAKQPKQQQQNQELHPPSYRNKYEGNEIFNKPLLEVEEEQPNGQSVEEETIPEHKECEYSQSEEAQEGYPEKVGIPQ